jgi:hypothetical protein
MGLVEDALHFLLAAQNDGVDFARTLTVGRQKLVVDAPALMRVFARHDRPLTRTQAQRIVTEQRGFAEVLLQTLGAQEVDSLDASDFEGATTVHDMNRPVPRDLEGRFSVVLDSGSLEHIFNFPTSIRNCMTMTAVGGHLVLITPANNQLGHGFYQFSPELFFRVLAPENGFVIEHMLLKGSLWGTPWYEVADPDIVGGRGQLVSSRVQYLHVMARRTHHAELIASTPQQSDYSVRWRRGARARTGGGRVWEGARAVARALPRSAQARRLDPYQGVTGLRTRIPSPRHYRRVKIAQLPPRDELWSAARSH